MILECPYCKFVFSTKYPIKDNTIDVKDMDRIVRHMIKEHPNVKGVEKC
jgi:hypothetical protein